MIISLEEFIKNIGSPIQDISTNSYLINSGGIETEEDWILSPCYINKKDNTSWGFYKIFNYITMNNLPSCDVVWSKQKQSTIYNDMTWRHMAYLYGLANTVEEFNKKYCNNGFRLTHQELLKLKKDMFIEAEYEETLAKALRRAYEYPDFYYIPTVEYPYKLVIYGADIDSSYTKVFDTNNNLQEFLQRFNICKFTQKDLWKMVFTN